MVADDAHQPARPRVRAAGVVATVGLVRVRVRAAMTPEEAVPESRPKPPGTHMTLWVIYDHPKDCPEGYVLRAQFVMGDGSIQSDEVAWFADHPDKLRAIVPFGLIRMTRAESDNPVILETWI